MNIFLINCAHIFGSSGGQLSAALHACAEQTLKAAGHNIRSTHIQNGYVPHEEVEHFVWMDAVIWQIPAWWMGLPWSAKKYIDEVFSAGHGTLFTNDGRHRDNPSVGYGTGGLLQGRQHMLSLTWNAPQSAFDAPGDFFEGRGVDAVFFPLHKACAFLGLQALPTFICTDVVKNPRVEDFLTQYRAHLQRHFPA